MFIDANAIRNLIEKYDNLSISMGYMPVNLLSVITDLESLIADEEGRMEKMAEHYEAEEYGRREMEEAVIEKGLQSFCPVEQ